MKARAIAFFWLLPFAAAGAEQGVLDFDKISRFDRSAEPVLFGLPLPKGAARNPRVTIERFPVQSRVSSRWPDGSARWLLVRALVDLPGNRAARLRWEVDEAPAPAPAPPMVRRTPDGSVEVDTGPLQAVVPAAGFLPMANVRVNGKAVSPEAEWMRGFTIRSGKSVFATPGATVKLEIAESGPVAAVVRAHGRHGGPDSPFDFQAELTFWKGKPYVAVEYRVLCGRGAGATPVDAWEWNASPRDLSAAVRLAQGNYSTRILEAGSGQPRPLTFFFGPEEVRYGQVEHAFQSYWGDFWLDWRGRDAGVAVTLQQAQQNFPKGMAASHDKLTLSLYPAQEKPLEFPLGAAKTHQMLFHFHDAAMPPADLSSRSLQFQIPDVPKLPSDVYRRSEVWDERVFHPKRNRRVEALVYDILDNRPVGMGIWNFGDEIEWGYSGQGRGRDELVWLNNEYDFAHLTFVEYARTGERRFLDFARAGATHWRDVDIAHVAPDPLRRGGHIAHSQRHRLGGVSASHQWVEGLFDAYHLYGDSAARDAALGIGENILRIMARPQYRDPANASTRDMGWALRAMLALYRETGDARYVEPCRRIMSFFKRWHKEYPGFLAPYTDHSMPRQNFMNALTLVSLARAIRTFPDDEVKRLIVAEAEDMLAHGRNALGLFYYKELPSLEHQGSTVMPLELMAEAYAISGDRRFIDAGLLQVEHALANMNMRQFPHTGAAEKFTPTHDGGYSRVLVYPPGGKHMGTFLMPMLIFLEAARDFEEVRRLDFQSK